MSHIIDKINNSVLFFVIYTFVFVLFFKTLQYTLPFILALIFAIILQKPTKFLIKQFKLKNNIASLISTLLFFTIIIALISFTISDITTEIIQLGKNAQTYFLNNTYNLNNLYIMIERFYNNLDPSIISSIKNNLNSSLTQLGNIAFYISSKLASYIISFASSIPYLIMVVIFTLLSTYFFTKDMSLKKYKKSNILSSDNANKFLMVINESKKMLINYLISYLAIIGLTFIETLIGFFIFKVKYALLLSIISAVFDILPILGIGAIYLPIFLIYLLCKNYVTAFGILILYIAVSIIRQIVEPKIISSTLDLNPVSVLAALFIGLKANGIFGMFFCLFLVVFYNIFKKVNII